MGQDNTIYIFSIKVSFSNKGQNKSKLQKQISKIFICLNVSCLNTDKQYFFVWFILFIYIFNFLMNIFFGMGTLFLLSVLAQFIIIIII